jgi:hypothetical protein
LKSKAAVGNHSQKIAINMAFPSDSIDIGNIRFLDIAMPILNKE